MVNLSVRTKGAKELCIGVGMRPDMLDDGSLWKEPGDRCIESVISKSSEKAVDICVDWEPAGPS
jgi:hypothetical protein